MFLRGNVGQLELEFRDGRIFCIVRGGEREALGKLNGAFRGLSKTVYVGNIRGAVYTKQLVDFGTTPGCDVEILWHPSIAVSSQCVGGLR